MADTVRDLAQRLGQQAEAVCRHYLSSGRREGGYWLVGDVRNTPGRSMFVRLKDGGVRNAYTVKIANKTPHVASYTVSIDGLPDARMELPEQSPLLAGTAHVTVPASDVGAFRLVVQGNPVATVEGRQEVTFQLKAQETGETLRYRALFMSPEKIKE